MLRPLTTGELLDRTFALYRKNFLLFVLIAAVPMVTLALVGTIAFVVPMIFLARNPGDPAYAAVAGLAMLGGLLIGGILFVFALAAARGATIIAVSSVYFDKPTRAVDCYRQMRSRIWRAFGVELGTWFFIALAWLAFIVPGILVAVRWALALPVCILEDAGFSVSVSRSNDLSDGKRWQIFLIYFLKVILDYAATYIAYIPLIVVIIVFTMTDREPPLWIFTLFFPLYGLCQIVFLPLSAIAFPLVYYDARVRKEALDLELLMDAQVSQAAAAGGLVA
jgi:hypothetical protein